MLKKGKRIFVKVEFVRKFCQIAFNIVNHYNTTELCNIYTDSKLYS